MYQSKQPLPAWARARCPRCGAWLETNTYYVMGRGYLVVWECAARAYAEPSKVCDYKRVI